MSSIPSQIRTIDPFAEYNSNVANKLTRMLSKNDNVLMSANSLQLTQDSTSPLTVAVVQTGYAIKDDVLIEISADHRVDFTDLENYIAPGAGFDEIGYYYVVLQYTYVKSRPAPEVHIKILKPTQRGGYPVDSLMMVGVVKVVNVGITQGIDLSDPFHNFDPDPGYEDNRREYVKSYVGTESNLPTHNTFTDQSRIAYDSESDSFWLGYENFWQEFGVSGSVMKIDTLGTEVGDLCYVDSTGAATAAIATGLDTGADISVVSVGLAVDSSGKGLTSGVALGVKVETAIVVNIGDLLYLSASEAGKVTNNKTYGFYQVVGRALTSGDSSNPIDIIFTPKVLLGTSLVGQIPASAWIADSTAALSYHYDLDISELDVYSDFAVLTSFFDSGTDLQYWPTSVKIRAAGDELRITMPNNTIDLNYIISTGGGGSIGAGGGGGGADHSLLLNLSHGASGHSGFAYGDGVDAGGNTHDNNSHAGTYIEASGVTYGNLLANSDIGPGSTQVAQGNHTHSGLIASGTVMLFYQASAPVGWVLKTTGFNTNSMLCIGTSLATGGSEDARLFNPTISTNAVGNHSHSISTQANHSHTYSGTTSVNSGAGKDQGGGSNDCAEDPHTHTFSGTTNGGGSHNHGGTTGNGGSHSHSVNYDTYNPWYVRVIAATKS
jgi:hypothetical protein